MKTWKQSTSIGMVAILVLVLALAACEDSNSGDPSTPAHSHTYDDWAINRAATCTTAGERQRVCIDDPTHIEKETIPIDPNAHNYEFVEGSGTAPTCTEDGQGNEICSYNPKHTKSGAVIQKLGHDWEWTTTLESTCTTKGEKSGICNNDHDHTTTEDIPIDDNAHKWTGTAGSVLPTCTTMGSGTMLCDYNSAHTMSGATIPALGHDYGEWVIDTHAGCMTKGKRHQDCKRGDDTVTEEINALGHDDGNWVITPADCEDDGKEELKCTRDHFILETVVLTKLGHDYSIAGDILTSATCTTAGVQEWICSHNESHVTTKPIAIDPTAHEWGAYAQTTPATCTTDGIETRTCTYSALHTETQPGEPALGHNEIYWGIYDSSTGKVFCNRSGCSGWFLEIGDITPGGAIIFYFNEEGFEVEDSYEGPTSTITFTYTAHYLEAAPENEVNQNGPGPILWGDQGKVVSGITTFANITEPIASKIGNGKMDTVIINQHMNDVGYINSAAAQVCTNKTVYGGGGWFLPSSGELNEMYKQRSYLGITSGYFWSSSQYPGDGSNAWVQDFSNGNRGHTGKFNPSGLDVYVRAIRAF